MSIIRSRWEALPLVRRQIGASYHRKRAVQVLRGADACAVRNGSSLLSLGAGPVFVKAVEASGSYAAGSAGSSGGLIQPHCKRPLLLAGNAAYGPVTHSGIASVV